MASLYTDQAGKLPSLQTLGFQQPNLLSGGCYTKFCATGSRLPASFPFASIGRAAEQFRPGRTDAQAIRQLTSSQLRVDCVQTRGFLNLLAPAAWVALAPGEAISIYGTGMAEPGASCMMLTATSPGWSSKSVDFN